MSIPLDDLCASALPKEFRMIFAREFIRQYLKDEDLRFIAGHTLDSLACLANIWVQRHARRPVSLSREDVQEAGFEILEGESL